MPVQKYQTRPVVVEAIRLTKETRNEILKWLGEDNYQTRSFDPVNIAFRTSNDGFTVAVPGDWILKNANGTFDVFQGGMFLQRYEPVKV